MQKKSFVSAVLLALGCIWGSAACCTAEEIHIQEELMENMSVDASMYIPEGTFASYKTRLKEFERDEVSGIFWPEAAEDEIQERELDGGGFSLTYREENAGTSQGTLRYFKDGSFAYLLELLAFGEWEAMLQEQELEFMSLSQAEEKMEKILDDLELGGEPVLSAAFGVSAGEMADLYGAMKEDEHYAWFFDSGKLADYAYGEEDEGYYLEYIFAIDGIPVYGPDSDSLRVSGGIDVPLPAYQCYASCYITSSGFRYFTLSGAVDGQMERQEEQELLSYGEVRPSIQKEYGDVILAEEYLLSEIWPEYLPLRDAETGSEISLIPVWCCRFDLKISGEEEQQDLSLTDRFHAFTGERVP